MRTVSYNILTCSYNNLCVLFVGGFTYGVYKLVGRSPTEAFDMSLTEELRVWRRNKLLKWGLTSDKPSQADSLEFDESLTSESHKQKDT